MSEKVPKGWKKVKLGEVATIKNGKSNSQDAVENGLYPFFDRSKQVKTSKKFLFDATAIIIPGEGKEFVPRFFKGKFDLHQRAYAIFDFQNNIIPEYVYYYILFSNKYFESVAVGSTVMSLRINHFIEYPIILPPLPEQKAIASVLSSLDDKIDLLHRQNQTLEQMAQTLFRKWFIEEAKEDWEIITFGDLVKPKKGKNLTKSKAIEGDFPVVAGGIEPSCYHNEANTKSPVITISASGANAGYTRLYYTPVWSSDSSYIDATVTPYIYFSYVFLKINQERLFDKQEGSAQPHIYPSHIMDLEMLNYPEELIKKFEEEVTPFFEKIKSNILQIQTLEKLRDTLLPKLMSGEIRIKNA
jgi:type I restriction enzyme S subunit